MNRKLVNSEQEIVALVVAALAERTGPEAVEHLLGVEFAFADGRYPRDLEAEAEVTGEWSWEEQPVDYTVYRRGEAPYFPGSYPTLVLYDFERGFDRFGQVESRVLVYAERREFQSP